MSLPKLACCNFISGVKTLKQFAMDHGFDGVDWSFTPDNLPKSPKQESGLVKDISGLFPLEVRYHCALSKVDLGDMVLEKSKDAAKMIRSLCRLVSKLGGRYLTIHVGLGHDSTNGLCWERTIEGLINVSYFANSLGVRLCLENLAWGWTSRPNLFEKLVRKSGALVTLDLGHAQVCHSVKCQHFGLEDFISPHPEKVINAHIYHEEREQGHMPPEDLEDITERLSLLKKIGCEWWVLELHEKDALLSTLKFVREFLDLELRKS